MGIKRKTMIAISAVIPLVAAGCGNQSSISNAIRVTAPELVSAYDNNPIAAEAAYDKRAVVISGIVNDISTVAIMGDIVIRLASGSDAPDVMLYINSSSRQQVTSINKGSPIKAECHHVYTVLGAVALNDCDLPYGTSPAVQPSLSTQSAPQTQATSGGSGAQASGPNNAASTGFDISANSGRLHMADDLVGFEVGSVKTTNFQITADAAPIEIMSAIIPTSATDVIKVQNIDCPISPVALQVGTSCSGSITSNGSRSIDAPLIITYRGQGASAPMTSQIRIVVSAVAAKNPSGW